ncbi:MAG: hypothetical protein ACE5SW_06870 [Nitrososphaeraceae archaeon]
MNIFLSNAGHFSSNRIGISFAFLSARGSLTLFLFIDSLSSRVLFPYSYTLVLPSEPTII